MKKIGLLIEGEMIDGSAGKTFLRINPISGEVATEAVAAQPEDVEKAIQSAQKGFLNWSALSPTERRMRLLKAADLMEKRSEDFILTARK